MPVDSIARGMAASALAATAGVSGPNVQNANYNFALSDLGGAVEHTDSSSSYTWTIPSQSVVQWPTSYVPVIKGYNASSGTLSVAPGSGVTLTGGGVSGTQTIAANSTFVLSRLSQDNWLLEASSAGLTVNSTVVSGASAGQILYSDGTKLQAGGAVIAASGAFGGAAIDGNVLAATGQFSLTGKVSFGSASNGFFWPGGGFVYGDDGANSMAIYAGLKTGMAFQVYNGAAKVNALYIWSATGNATFGYDVQAASFTNGASGPKWLAGTGTPEGAVTAPVGSLFSRTNGGANTTLYVKESGSGNTGWIAK